MAANRFEQVDERQEDAMTLILANKAGVAHGTVIFPAALSGGQLSQDMISPELPAQEAFRSAVKLANERKVALVVVDHETLWQEAWGELYRYEDEDGAAEA